MEIFAHLIMFNAVSRNVAFVHVPKQKNNKHPYQISFKEACTLTRKYFAFPSTKSPDELLNDIRDYVQAVRPSRSDKRKIKT